MTNTERNERIAVEVLGWEKAPRGYGVTWYTSPEKDEIHMGSVPNFVEEDSHMAMLVGALRKKYIDVDFSSWDEQCECCQLSWVGGGCNNLGTEKGRNANQD